MTLGMYYEPIEPTEPRGGWGMPAKYVICKAFGESDGSLHEDFVLTKDHIPTLAALQRVHGDEHGIAGQDDDNVGQCIGELIEAIRQSGSGAIRIWTE